MPSRSGTPASLRPQLRDANLGKRSMSPGTGDSASKTSRKQLCHPVICTGMPFAEIPAADGKHDSHALKEIGVIGRWQLHPGRGQSARYPRFTGKDAGIL